MTKLLTRSMMLNKVFRHGTWIGKRFASKNAGSYNETGVKIELLQSEPLVKKLIET